MNQTRNLYQQIMLGHKPSEADETKFIDDGQAVKNFRKTRVAVIIDEWIAKQRAGQSEYMQVEIGSLNGLSIFKWFNAFLKYIYLVQEDRAYRKLEAFLITV